LAKQQAPQTHLSQHSEGTEAIPSTLAALVRTRSSGFGAADCTHADDLVNLDALRRACLPADLPFQHLPAVFLTPLPRRRDAKGGVDVRYIPHSRKILPLALCEDTEKSSRQRRLIQAVKSVLQRHRGALGGGVGGEVGFFPRTEAQMEALPPHIRAEVEVAKRQAEAVHTRSDASAAMGEEPSDSGCDVGYGVASAVDASLLTALLQGPRHHRRASEPWGRDPISVPVLSAEELTPLMYHMRNSTQARLPGVLARCADLPLAATLYADPEYSGIEHGFLRMYIAITNAAYKECFPSTFAQPIPFFSPAVLGAPRERHIGVPPHERGGQHQASETVRAGPSGLHIQILPTSTCDALRRVPDPDIRILFAGLGVVQSLPSLAEVRANGNLHDLYVSRIVDVLSKSGT
jgi:hypothetical protein